MKDTLRPVTRVGLRDRVRVRRRPSSGLVISDPIMGITPDSIDRPTGAFRVELFNARNGKRVFKEDQANYLSPSVLQGTNWWQIAQFKPGYWWPGNNEANANISALNGWNRNLACPPASNVGMVAATNSAVAENTASAWGTGETVAWASAWKAAGVAASGKRGQINEAQCDISLTTLTTVWDFLENQGNGTFRSLNICSTEENGRLVARCGGAGSLAWTNPANGTYHAVAGADDTYIYCYAADDTGPTTWFYRTAWADITLQDDGTYAMGSWSLIMTEPVTATSATTGTTNHYANEISSICIIPGSSDYMITTSPGAGGLSVHRVTSGGSVSWSLIILDDTPTPISTGPGRIVCNAAGTKAYAIYTNPSGSFAQTIHRVDLATQTVDATYNTPSELGASQTHAFGLAMDHSDDTLYISTDAGIYVMDVSDGSILGYLGHPRGQSLQDTASAPFDLDVDWNTPSAARKALYQMLSTSTSNGSYVGGGLGALDFAAVDLSDTGAAATESGLYFCNGKLWTANDDVASLDGLVPVVGNNIWSRTRLASDTAKSSSQVMKFTYALTLPSAWHSETHEAPPI